jgi:hypothetical protein
MSFFASAFVSDSLDRAAPHLYDRPPACWDPLPGLANVYDNQLTCPAKHFHVMSKEWISAVSRRVARGYTVVILTEPGLRVVWPLICFDLER